MIENGFKMAGSPLPVCTYIEEGDSRPILNIKDLEERAQGLSKIERHEEPVAQFMVNKQFIDLTGKPLDLSPAGYMVAIKVWVPEEKIKAANGTEFFLPDEVRDERKFTSGVGLVCALGPDAYRDTERYPLGPWCKVGDFVMFQRYEAIALSYRGVAMALIPDDRILAVISDPSEIESINSASKL